MNRYKNYMNNVPGAPGLEKKVLSEIKEESNISRTAAPRHSIARFAGIAAALVILAGGVFALIWMQDGASPPFGIPVSSEPSELPPPGSTGKSKPYPNPAPDFNSQEFADITPGLMPAQSSDIGRMRVLKHRENCETYVVKHNGDYAQLGSGFGGYGVVDIEYDAEFRGLIYTYSFGSGLHRSHVGVFSLDGFAQTYISQAYTDGDMCLERASDGSWGIYKANITIGTDFSDMKVEKGEFLDYLVLESLEFYPDPNNPKVFYPSQNDSDSN